MAAKYRTLAIAGFQRGIYLTIGVILVTLAGLSCERSTPEAIVPPQRKLPPEPGLPPEGIVPGEDILLNFR